MTGLSFATTIDAKDVQRSVARYVQQLPYATATALNRVQEEIFFRERKELPSRFIIRNRALLGLVAPQQVPRDMQARKGQTPPRVLISALRAGRLFNPFEEGEPKTRQGLSQMGRQESAVAVPTSALRSRGSYQVIPKALFPHNLGLVARLDEGKGAIYYALGRNSKRKNLTPYRKGRILGKQGTFILDPSRNKGLHPNAWGVYQRFGPGKHDIRMLWAFKASVPRPKRYQLYQTSSEVTEQMWQPAFAAAMKLALATAR